MKVSVLIPCYNAEAFMRAAIDSVLSQTHTDIECIVIDDCSKDATWAVAAAYQARDPRVVPLQLPRNGGPSAARNAGISAASGEWIAVLDADDQYLPDRIEVLLKEATALNADLIADNQINRAFDTQTFLGQPFSWLKSQPVQITLDNYWHPPGARGADDAASAFKPLIRKSFLDAHGVRYPEAHRMSEDLYFYAACLVAGARFFAIPYAGYIHSVRPGSLTLSGGWSHGAKVRVYDDLLHKFGDKLGTVFSRDIVRKRARALRMASYAVLSECLQRRDWRGAARQILSEPQSLLPIPGIVARKIGRRFFP